ncbi:TlpA disulfide reductase family protein [Parapedobacter koreensis]|uniref:Thiol-disulfide isomerase or thioredoxin n=1 Tax=Parapedobacter koreensis TaxID=332977 RepID=A0A1H7TRZ8_9SPHI|nr:TlpA disulfide reductase family protein [Parapedobacter koreensis]SEL87521.1 Thiol-disulfide isomerase or thioredoxin [Parapedobacter koreensis]
MKRAWIAMVVVVFSANLAVAQERVSLITLDGLEKRLFNGGDTTFVVNFWATWCAPCVAEMPHFEKLQQHYQSKPLRVLFVSLDARKYQDAVLNFVNAKGLKNEVLILDERDEQYFIPQISAEWSGAIPATLFVNTGKGVRIFKEQEFDYQQLERNYLSIVQQNQ